MIIKQNEQFQLNASLVPYRNGFSLTLSQRWPQAQNPHWRTMVQVLLDEAELAKLRHALQPLGRES